MSYVRTSEAFPDGKAARWWQFTRERFEPISHLLMVGLFYAAHLAVARVVSGSRAESALGTVLFIAALAFFFLLRLYDEIKDYEVDLRINPTRPLARGLLVHQDLYKGIVICIAIVIASFLLAGPLALASACIAVGYSLLMYKEFFIGSLLRPHLTTYAMTHTIVSSFLSLALFAALTGGVSWDLAPAYYVYALANWGLFNIYEFGRKTFATSEERPGVASYSNIFGRAGAVVLVLVMSLGSTLGLIHVLGQGTATLACLVGDFVALLAVGAAYVATDSPKLAAAWRAFSSAYIVLVYAEVVILVAGGSV